MAPQKFTSRADRFVPDDRQRQAIEHVHGPMLVVAGAGTGKTSVLTHRIERLVHQENVRPGEILALTYTINAANEMRDRVRKLLGGRSVQAATFHDYCLKLLQQVDRAFGVLDEQDLWVYVRRRIHELRLEYYMRAANIGQFIGDLLKFMERCHDELVTPERYVRYVEALERGEFPLPRVVKSKKVLDDDEIMGRCREIARVFSTVEGWLREENLGTFGHMIMRAYDVLSHEEAILEEARAGARFILADEFQDANFAQIKILSLLAGSTGNIFAVGDPDQGIYRFRGASSAAFELFQRSFPNPKLVVLEKNRRSTTAILRTAFALIDENPPPFAKRADGSVLYRRTPLVSARDEEAEQNGLTPPSRPVTLVVTACKGSDGPDVVRHLRDAQRKLKCKWSDFCVLYRAHSNRDDVVQELAEQDIPFVIENMDVFDTPECRDLLACVRAVVSSGDDVSWFRMTALPCFHIDPEQLRQILRSIARDNREAQVVPLSLALDRIQGGAEVVAAVRGVREAIRRKQAKAAHAVDMIVRQFALDVASPTLQAVIQFVRGWENRKVNRSTELEELVDFLGYFREAGGVIPLAANENENAVRLMTVHGAKGLEFPHVVVLRANSGSFPTYYKETLVAFPTELRDPDSFTESDDKTLHGYEERRLFYVGMTRARDTLHIYAREGTGKTDKTPAGYMRDLMGDKKIAPWFRWINATGAQAPLDLAAGASPVYANESRTTQWFELPVLDGLHRRLSASAVETYQRCGLQFKLDRDWRIPGRPAAAMQYGAAVHRVLKTYFDSVRLGRPKTDEELIEIFKHDLASAKIPESYQHELYERLGVEQLQNFLGSARKISASEVLHTEESFEFKIGETTVVGRIDRIDQRPDGTVAIIDYKTGKGRDQDNADRSLQLSLYAIAAKEKWGYKVGALIFYNLEENAPVITTRSEATLQSARVCVEEAAEGIRQGVFEAKPGQHCNFCSYRSLCPEQEKCISRKEEVAKS